MISDDDEKDETSDGCVFLCDLKTLLILKLIQKLKGAADLCVCVWGGGGLGGLNWFSEKSQSHRVDATVSVWSFIPHSYALLPYHQIELLHVKCFHGDSFQQLFLHYFKDIFLGENQTTEKLSFF